MQMLPQTLRCTLGRHEPDRHKVEWDGLHYVGKCKGCGADIYRVAQKRWRLIGPE